MLSEFFNAMVWQRIEEHLWLSLLGLIPAILIAVPAGLYIGHTGRGRGVAVALSGGLRAIPSLGLLTVLALFLPGGAVERAWLPSTIVLVILAIPPILAAAYAGVQQIKPSVIDGARATGHSEMQILRSVEIPLALPQILDGIRSAAAQVVATATLCAYIGTGGLGRYLIDGLAQRDTQMMVVGVVWVIVLVLVLEAMRILPPHPPKESTPRAAVTADDKQWLPAAVAVISAVAVLALVAGGTVFGGARNDDIVRVGSANFPESEIIAQIYVQALEEEGIDAELVPGIGARDAYLSALENGEISVVPEYVGNLTQFYADSPGAPKVDLEPGTTSEDAAHALEKVLPEGLKQGELAEAESKDSYRVMPEVAERYGLKELGDLPGLVEQKGGNLRLGATPEVETRTYGPPGLNKVYGVPADRIEVVPISDGGGPLTVQALLDGSVDIADIYTTTPVLGPDGQEVEVVELADPELLILPQNVLPIFREEGMSDEARQVLEKVQAALTTEALKQMNLRNSGAEKADSLKIAKDWLQENNI